MTAPDPTPGQAQCVGDCKCGHIFERHLLPTPGSDPCMGGTPGFCGCTGYRPASVPGTATPEPPADTQQDDEHEFCCGEGEQFVQRAGEVLFEHARSGKGNDYDDELLSALLPAVLAYGEAQAERAALSARPSADTETLRELAEWLVSLDDDDPSSPGRQGRRTVTLAAIIDRARTALDGGPR